MDKNIPSKYKNLGFVNKSSHTFKNRLCYQYNKYLVKSQNFRPETSIESVMIVPKLYIKNKTKLSQKFAVFKKNHNFCPIIMKLGQNASNIA